MGSGGLEELSWFLLQWERGQIQVLREPLSWPFPELFEVHLFLLRGSVSTCSIFTLGLALILGFCIPSFRKNPSIEFSLSNMMVGCVDGT